MAFSKQVQRFLDMVSQVDTANDPLLLRRMVKQTAEVYGPPRQHVAATDNLSLAVNEAMVPVRLYYPSITKKTPLIIFYHGGGHMTGDIDVYDTQVRMIVHHTQMTVASVDYRLSPEFPYPVGFNDCLAVTQWLMKNYQQVNVENKFFVAGDSAGGNYAANVALALKEKLCAQVLIYPSLDFSCSFPSHEKFAQGYLLHRDKIDYYFQHYLKNIKADSTKVSPVFVDDVTSVAPAFIATAQFDPLHDEGEMYAEKLKQKNIHCLHVDYPNTLHAFMMLYKLFEAENKHFYGDLKHFVASF